MSKNFFAYLTLVMSLFAIYFGYKTCNAESYIHWTHATPLEKLQILVSQDFIKTKDKNEFPKEWSALKGYQVYYHSSIAEYFFKKIQVPMGASPQGIYYAKIDIVDIPDAKNPGFLLQISLINHKTNDKVEEFAKDYYLADLEKVPKFAQLSWQ